MSQDIVQSGDRVYIKAASPPLRDWFVGARGTVLRVLKVNVYDTQPYLVVFDRRVVFNQSHPISSAWFSPEEIVVLKSKPSEDGHD